VRYGRNARVITAVDGRSMPSTAVDRDRKRVRTRGTVSKSSIARCFNIVDGVRTSSTVYVNGHLQCDCMSGAYEYHLDITS